MKALFLDRDGVINQRLPNAYVRSPDEFILLEDVLPILQLARDRGYLLLLASNQQGVGKGLMTADDLNTVHNHMQQLIRARLGFALDHAYYCTDVESKNSHRRKPAPGMLYDGLRDYHLTASVCWFLGDSLTDAQAGRSAGVNTALVGNHPVGSADIITVELSAMYENLRIVL